MLPDECGADRRLALFGPRAAALGAAGRLTEALAELAQVLELLNDKQSSIGARIACFIAVIDRLPGHDGEARNLLERSLRELGDPHLTRPPSCNSSWRQIATKFHALRGILVTGEWDFRLSRTTRLRSVRSPSR